MAVTIVLLFSATGLSKLPLSDTEHQLFRQAIVSPFRVEMTLSSVGEVATVQGYCISIVIWDRTCWCMVGSCCCQSYRIYDRFYLGKIVH